MRSPELKRSNEVATTLLLKVDNPRDWNLPDTDNICFLDECWQCAYL